MAIASILDPRCKFHVVEIYFPLIYKLESEVEKNVNKVRKALQVLYDEYVNLSREGPFSYVVNIGGSNSLSTVYLNLYLPLNLIKS